MLPLPSWVRTISVILFVVSFIGGMTLVSWYEAAQVRGDTVLETLVAIIVKGESVAVVSAAIGGAFEGGAFIVVIAYEMVKRGFDRGRAQGVEEGVVKGRAQGLVKGRAQGLAKGLAYAEKVAAHYERKQEALERGEEFNEPLPMFEDDEVEEQD